MHRFSIGQLLSKPLGYTSRFEGLHIKGDFADFPDISSENDVVFDLEIIRLSHEFTVHISNVKYELTMCCSKCLSEFLHTIAIESTSRQYIYDLPKENIMADEEVEQIDRSKMELDILPFLREELLLHLPSFPVCFAGCKGLCATCGVNLNTTTCSCNKETQNNPFKQLL